MTQELQLGTEEDLGKTKLLSLLTLLLRLELTTKPLLVLPLFLELLLDSGSAH
jgi:hypothetical protein